MPFNDFHSSLPQVVMPEVYHVGSFDADEKGQRGHSLEGNGLSFSLHPQAWISIAKLGGLPTWKMTAAEGHGRFVDAHALSESQNAAIAAWGVAQGWVQVAQRWKASWLDCERDADEDLRSWSLYPSEEVAILESECNEDPKVEPVVVHCATEKMSERCGFDPGDMGAVDILRTFFAEDHGYDGVWWNDVLDPFSLSAPRGVINQASLVEWSKECVQEARPRMRGARP